MAPAGLESRIGAVGTQLSASLRRVLDELPGGPHRPNQLARLLSLNRDISGRVLAAARDADPLTVAHVVPGPEPLRKLLRAARRRDVPAEIIDQAEEAVQSFEALIRDVAGDRPALDAIISGMVPDARESFELAARQTAFKGISLIKGAMAEIWLHTAIVHPSSQSGDHHDVAYVYGTLGLRRLRPSMVVKFTYRQFGVPERTWRTLDGLEPGQTDGRELDRYCSLPPATLNAAPAGDGVIYALAGEAVGPQSSSDKLLAEIHPRSMSRYAARRPRNRKSLFVAPSIPVKLLVFDLLLHEEAFAGASPELMMYDTAVDGMASVNDPARDADRLVAAETIAVLGRGAAGLALSEMPRYVPMLQFVSGKLGWDLDRFRGYRCRVHYPMHGLQVCMAFDAPPSPAGATGQGIES
jgi:hypothetical protein